MLNTVMLNTVMLNTVMPDIYHKHTKNTDPCPEHIAPLSLTSLNIDGMVETVR